MNIRVLTYNIRHGRGIDGRIDLDRILRLLRDSAADLICLQEVDRSMPRSGFVHQSEWLGRGLGFSQTFHANYGVLSSGMGNAILSRHAIHSTWNISLPFLGEPRGLLCVRLEFESVPIHALCTHFGLTVGQRRQQSTAIARKLLEIGGPAILCGDLNASSLSLEVGSLLRTARLTDVGPAQGLTFPANIPSVKIDYILTTNEFTLLNSQILTTQASDHLPILAELDLKA
jgi:endonuclease/exonuclease/phosphatase family metal-dependent hydrolase